MVAIFSIPERSYKARGVQNFSAAMGTSTPGPLARLGLLLGVSMER